MCGADPQCIHLHRVALANAFFFEPEFQETGSFLYRSNKAAFGVRPAYAQFKSDRNSVIGGAELDQGKMDFMNDFVLRSAFVARYPNSLTPEMYVDAVNVNTGNSLTLAERDALIAGLQSGAETRGSVLRKIADNKAFVDREYNASFVLTQYFGYLRRDPDTEGFDFWLNEVNKFPLRDLRIQQAMVCAFITSSEYQLRFSPIITHSNAECGQ